MPRIKFEKITIDANDIHLKDELIIKDENKQEMEIIIFRVKKIKDEKLVILETSIGVIRFGWFSTLLINRPVE